MAKEDWGNLGEEIKNLVESAIDSKDYQTLNKSLEKTVNSALNSVEESLRRSGVTYRQPQNRQRTRDRTYRSSDAQEPWRGRSTQPPKVVKNTPIYSSTFGLQGAGIAFSIIGWLLTGGLGLAILILLLVAFLTGSMGFGYSLSIGIMAPLLLGSGLLTWRGMTLLGRLKRFRAYVRQLGGRGYCSVRELAESIGKTESYVRKDLRMMIQKRMFRQGRLDKAGSCLIVTDEAWGQYLEAEKQYALREEEQKRIQQMRQAEERQINQKMESVPDDVKQVIAQGRAYLDRIRESNEAIPGKEISAKISRMELVVEKILDRVQNHPELIGDLSKFMEYYLPTTVKLLGAYEELDAQPVQGSNIINSKREIESSLDTINQAFENLLDGFFQDTAWDISSDISVLQMMLAQEGLTEDGLRTGAFETQKDLTGGR
ncbi:MAG: 5-bromo-4-chloroindolyl phosphate hydrolysis family protein [Hominisplanchenecus sp.]|nr:5-bromo-4-chloroindolyl phosphate hydrolysis family protein [Lachnospiraceae bacterium]MDY2818819.1 5-bromo-4-chloroindolyl phosphate hydrolysis family protein [Hominisplanchenecus sp.]